MKVKPKPRKHGKSRIETLLEASIRQELAYKRMKYDLLQLSMRIAVLERGAGL